MKAIYVLVFLIIMQSLLAFAQKNKFEVQYDYVTEKLLNTDLNAARRMSDSLVEEANNPEQQIKSLLLSARVYRDLDDFKTALEKAKIAERKADLSGYYEWATVAGQFLIENFREVGLLDESYRFLVRAKVNGNLIADSSRNIAAKAMLLQEEALNSMSKGDYVAALKLLENVAEFGQSSKKKPKVSNLQLITYKQLLGECYLELGRYEMAKNYLTSALNDTGDQEISKKAELYQLLARRSLKMADLDSSSRYLELAEPYVEYTDKLKFQEKLYLTYAKLYEATENYASSNHYFELYNKAILARSGISLTVANGIIAELSHQQTLVRRRNLILLWALLFLGAVSMLSYILRRQKKRYPEFEQSGEKLYNRASEETEVLLPIPISVKDGHTENELNISIDTENRLIKDLNKLEADQFFLDKNITLTKLANKVQSNQKYVSFIIKKYRNQNFNDYVLHLRIQYLIDLLKENEHMLDYKLSYLADIAGFSSHSKFTMAFKAVVGIPPSQYMEDLRNLQVRRTGA